MIRVRQVSSVLIHRAVTTQSLSVMKHNISFRRLSACLFAQYNQRSVLVSQTLLD
jgi:hypothetical protein